jgi:Holliday junction resolvase RusA-like endonuclease
VIRGKPITKKNSSQFATNKATGRTFIVPSAPHKKWLKGALPQVQAQWQGGPIGYPVQVEAQVWRERKTGDLINYLQALADLLQKANVLADDKWILSWDGSRMDKDAEDPRIECVITPLDCPF